MKTPWAAAWDRLVRVLLRLDIRTGAVSKHSSTLQQAFEAAAASEQMRIVRTLPAAAPAAATTAEGEQQPEGAEAGEGEPKAAAAAGDGSKQSSRRNSAQQAAAAAGAAAALEAERERTAAAAAAKSDSGDEGEEEEQLCITAQEFEGVSFVAVLQDMMHTVLLATVMPACVKKHAAVDIASMLASIKSYPVLNLVCVV